MKRKVLLLICSFLLSKAFAQDNPVAIVGATIIDLTNYGNNTVDIPNGIVVMKNGKIIAAGEKNEVKIPGGATIIHAEGKYIIPGLIDCFSVIGTQGQANAHLYYGVTTIVAGPGDGRRKGYLPNGNPSPHIKMLAIIPSAQLEEKLEKKNVLSAIDIQRVSVEVDHIDSLKKAGVCTILLQHMFPEVLLTKVVAECNKFGDNSIAEIQYAPYTSALKAGVNSFVHTSRYMLGMFPDSIITPLIKTPDDKEANTRARNYIMGIDPNTDPSATAFAGAIASSNTALMPTFSMLYTSLPDHKNIWQEPGAHLTKYSDVFDPMDTLTGKSNSFMSAKFALRQIEFEKAFVKAGVHYITGSGADAFGSLPGISEHIEIAMMHRYGLTTRQAIAAATNNPSVFNHWKNIGMIAAGRDADILILVANPLDDLENLKKIDRLYLDGKPIDRKALLTLPGDK